MADPTAIITVEVGTTEVSYTLTSAQRNRLQGALEGRVGQAEDGSPLPVTPATVLRYILKYLRDETIAHEAMVATRLAEQTDPVGEWGEADAP